MKKVKLVLYSFIGITLLSILGGGAFLIYIKSTLPKLESLKDYHPPIRSQILSKDGTVLLDVGLENRDVVPYEDIPEIVVQSFIAAEDTKFFEHSGVDYLGIARALWADIKARKIVQGGSTITQQVAISFLLKRDRGFVKKVIRKMKDVLLAIEIEKHFSKQEILYLYLNQVYFGGGYYGVKSAFKGYFDKELEEATIAECAVIAGLLVAPGRYSPYLRPKFAKMRQGYVLSRLLDTKTITKEQYEQAKAEKIKYRLRKRSPFKAGHFTDWVRQRVIDVVGNDYFLKNGFKVVTTIDYDLQEKAEKYVLDGVKAIDKRQGFKGPLGNLSLDELKEYDKNFRINFYKDNSSFFTLSEDFKKEYELSLDEEHFDEIYSSKEEFILTNKKLKLYPGNSSKEDQLFDMIQENKSYTATVLKIDDYARVVFVSLGGLTGVIPYEGFRWAHERVISESKNLYPYVTRPSTILKIGDQVLVNVKKKKVKLWKKLYSSFRKSYEKSKEKEAYKDFDYILCDLDQVAEVEAALVSIDPKSGELVSFVGGSDFNKSQFNRVIQSLRQPGSSFKPLLFAAALEQGFTPSTIILDSPEALGGVDASLNWKPRNYDGKFEGPVTFRHSLEDSRNVPTIKIAEKLGVNYIHDFSKRIGLNAKLDPDLSLALGSFGVSLLNIVSTYAIFPNEGKRVVSKSIISVTDRFGKTYEIPDNIDEIETQEDIEENVEEVEELEEEQVVATDSETEEIPEEIKVNPFLENLNEEQVYDKRLAYIMNNLMKGIVKYGTGRGTKSISNFIGGKTGTTNSYVDAWFIGFSSNLATGVWTGFDDNKTLGWGETGAKSALPIWRSFMKASIDKYGEKDFKLPSGIVNVLINKKTGELAKSQDSGFMEAFVEGTEPGVDSESKIFVNEKESEQESQVMYEDADFYE